MGRRDLESEAEMKKCDRCKKKILPDEKGTMLRDFIDNDTIDSTYWHFDCFIAWRNESLEQRATAIYADTMKKILPGFESMIGGIITNVQRTNKSNL